MDMYEERPPEIFTGGYFDQARGRENSMQAGCEYLSGQYREPDRRPPRFQAECGWPRKAR